MAKPKRPIQAEQDIELLPDAWARFERLVDAAAEAGPQPKKAAQRPSKGQPKKPRRKGD